MIILFMNLYQLENRAIHLKKSHGTKVLDKSKANGIKRKKHKKKNKEDEEDEEEKW